MSSGEILANSVTTKSQPYDSDNSGMGRGNSVSNNSGTRGKGKAGKGRGGRGKGLAFNDPDVVCQLCGRAKHTVWRCWYRFDPTFQPQSNFLTQNRTNPGQFQAHLLTSATLDDPAWYPDSGSSSDVPDYAKNFITKTAFSGLKSAEKKIKELSDKIKDLEERLEACHKVSPEPEGDLVPNISTLSLDRLHDLVLTFCVELPPQKFRLSFSRLSNSFRVPSGVGGHSLRQFTPLEEFNEKLILEDGKVFVNVGWEKFDTGHWSVIKAAENNRRCMLGFYEGLEDEIYYNEETFVGLPFKRTVAFSSDIPFFLAEIRGYGVFFAFKYHERASAQDVQARPKVYKVLQEIQKYVKIPPV